jgi:phospholipase C
VPPKLPQQRIKHIVVLMLENRSLDHVFGFFQPSSGQTIENLKDGNSNLSNLLDPSKPSSNDNPAFKVGQDAPFAIHDKDGPPHSFHAVCLQLCNNIDGPSAANPVKNNGFIRAYKDDLLRRTHHIDQAQVTEVMLSFATSQLPAINQLAKEFALCDHWFCEVPGPTMPNRMYIHAATSEGYVHNAFDRDFTSKTIYELVQEKGLTWCTYFHDLNEVLQFKSLGHTPDHFRRFGDRWITDVASGDLPNYVFILPRFNNKKAAQNKPAIMANSQHAPEDVRFGEHLIADVYDALAANAQLFAETVLIVTYDEHGGFFEHIAPGPAPNPDKQDSPNADDKANFKVPSFSFDRLGLRVPALIVSPWIKQGIVVNRDLQHTSVIKTAIELFGLKGPLNRRDDSAASFADLFSQLSAPRPSNQLPNKLKRPPLQNTVVSLVAGVRVEPADEPLDSLLEEWVSGLATLTSRRVGVSRVEALAARRMPRTQGEATELIEACLKSLGV